MDARGESESFSNLESSNLSRFSAILVAERAYSLRTVGPFVPEGGSEGVGGFGVGVGGVDVNGCGVGVGEGAGGKVGGSSGGGVVVNGGILGSDGRVINRVKTSETIWVSWVYCGSRLIKNRMY